MNRKSLSADDRNPNYPILRALTTGQEIRWQASWYRVLRVRQGPFGVKVFLDSLGKFGDP